MRDKSTKSLWLNSFSLAFSFSLFITVIATAGCTIKIPNVKVCAVAGIMAAGADCAYTLSDETEELSLKEFINFLEPQVEKPDPDNPGEMIPARGPALCQSTEDYTKIKIALEQACKKLGSGCSKELRKALKSASKRMSKLGRKRD